MIAATMLPGPVGGLSPHEGASLLEPGRAMWVFPFADHPPTVLFSYRTDDVDAEFTGRPAERVRAAYGPQPTGRRLGEALDTLDSADEFLFDSVEQPRMDAWSHGRVVLVGDSAWCPSLYAAMGISAGLAGMLHRHPGDIRGALRAWEAQLRPHMTYYQADGVEQGYFFTPDNQRQVTLRPLMGHSLRLPVIGNALRSLRSGSRSIRERERDIAHAG
ncbi:hypothetical protein [Nonomuraea sp. NPDC005501]|uniref:hypothetical protein n=1 Tax=Nonomuraea sp. NPDC005501 TaxID=3156884 RepID=UPI0033B5454A